MSRKTERRMTEVLGVILPGAFYDAAGLMEAAGIGEPKLMELRKAGKLTTYTIEGTGRNWFRGEDVLALMKPKAAIGRLKTAG